jgi:hypothetical protein
MKYLGIKITAHTLPLVTHLNDGVEPGPESMDHMFIYPATKSDENNHMIITQEEFKATLVVSDVAPLWLVHVKE